MMILAIAIVATATAVQYDTHLQLGTYDTTSGMMRSYDAGGPPDCGEAWDQLPDFARSYAKSIQSKVCNHPGTGEACRVFDSTLQCWFKYMVSKKCHGLQSVFENRHKDLCKACNDPAVSHLDIWMTHFLPEEQNWWRQNFHPRKDVELHEKDNGEKEDTPEGSVEVNTAFELFGKEIMCATLAIVDDQCVKQKSMRCENYGSVASKENALKAKIDKKQDQVQASVDTQTST